VRLPEDFFELVAFFFGAELKKGTAFCVGDDVSDDLSQPIAGLPVQFLEGFLFAFLDFLLAQGLTRVVLWSGRLLRDGKGRSEQTGREYKEKAAESHTLHKDTSIACGVKGGKARLHVSPVTGPKNAGYPTLNRSARKGLLEGPAMVA
jgi:hypothetical protein